MPLFTAEGLSLHLLSLINHEIYCKEWFSSINTAKERAILLGYFFYESQNAHETWCALEFGFGDPVTSTDIRRFRLAEVQHFFIGSVFDLRLGHHVHGQHIRIAVDQSLKLEEETSEATEGEFDEELTTEQLAKKYGLPVAVVNTLKRCRVLIRTALAMSFQQLNDFPGIGPISANQIIDAGRRLGLRND